MLQLMHYGDRNGLYNFQVFLVTTSTSTREVEEAIRKIRTKYGLKGVAGVEEKLTSQLDIEFGKELIDMGFPLMEVLDRTDSLVEKFDITTPPKQEEEFENSITCDFIHEVIVFLLEKDFNIKLKTLQCTKDYELIETELGYEACVY